ncbi:MAG: LacI family DNA-binding transcriptional regulator [Lachnospiraceae bacterium]|nr:LacI family DNA-binding transcriptional regulator [Lachnospiraceae bacterium]
MTSIKDVAKHAGVAISTVSKVLNNYPNISEATREKVNKAVEELNFVPNSVAAALSSKNAGRVALMIDLNVKTQAIDEMAMRYISGAITKAMELNLDVITVFVFMFQEKTTDELIRYLQSQSISGIIIYGASEDDLVLQELIASEKFKCVVVDQDCVGDNTSSVTIDHKRAQYDVAKILIEESHAKKILYISGYEKSYVTRSRLRGIKEAVSENGVEMVVKNADFLEEKAAEVAMQYGRDVDAIVCASDLMALGAQSAMRKLQLQKPICGFDGISLMSYVGQGIYTIRQNFSQISAIAMEEVQRLMLGEKGQIIDVDYSLIRN